MRPEPADMRRSPSKGAISAAEIDFPEHVEPMLADTLSTPHHFGDEDGWAFEMKWDGVRAIAYLAGGPSQAAQPQRAGRHRRPISTWRTNCPRSTSRRRSWTAKSW